MGHHSIDSLIACNAFLLFTLTRKSGPSRAALRMKWRWALAPAVRSGCHTGLKPISKAVWRGA